ncbi:hypothetical protein ACH5RR_021468 [Cinchona calisaya]|uniref:Secreted protein n=1 Tax=Cinchona calisaya TaxID=153742 RepID=A0ABD2ZHF0_9GENT
MILFRIHFLLIQSCLVCSFSIHESKAHTILFALSCTVASGPHRFLLAVAWTRPEEGSYKLNMDGSLLGNNRWWGYSGLFRTISSWLFFIFLHVHQYIGGIKSFVEGFIALYPT